MSPKPNNQPPASPSLRERAIDAYDSARDRALVTTARAGEMPLLALGGGLVLGVILGALLPKTKTEVRLLGKAGGRITEGARAAAEAAREAGREKLSELNITRDAGTSAVQSLVDGLGEAVRTSGRAALDAVRNKD